jgi:hypothetical protein
MPENDFADGLSTRALDTIDTVVATVNDKAIRPVVVAARAVVFGLIAALVGVAVVIMATVGVVRLLTDDAFAHHVWITYFVVGGIFCAVGTFLFSKRGTTPHA